MKNQAFRHRLGFAAAGARFAFAHERSFRAQAVLAVSALAVLAILRPPLLWWALCLLSACAVLTAELINTALEQILDRLHPEQHASIRIAKDCAAAAVLCASVAAAGVGALTVLVALAHLS